VTVKSGAEGHVIGEVRAAEQTSAVSRLGQGCGKVLPNLMKQRPSHERGVGDMTGGKPIPNPIQQRPGSQRILVGGFFEGATAHHDQTTEREFLNASGGGVQVQE